MNIPPNMTPEQLRQIEQAYPNSMNPVASWRFDQQRRLEQESQERQKNEAIAKLAAELMGDLEGCTLDATFMIEIAGRVHAKLDAEGSSWYDRGYSKGQSEAEGDGP